MTVQIWGFFVALGLLVALFLGVREARRRSIDTDAFLNFSLLVILGALIGGRLLYVLLFWQNFSSDLATIAAVWNGGMVFYGGVIGGIIAGLLYIRFKSLKVLTFLDILAAIFPAGYAIGRIGCHLIRDHMGKMTTVLWGFEVAPGVIRHDTALYSILTGIILFCIVWPLRKRIQHPGILTALTIFLYAIARIITDSFRAADLLVSDPRWYGFTISQYISLAAVVSSGLILGYYLRVLRPNVPPTS